MKSNDWLSPEQEEMVRAFADNNMNLSDAARVLYRGRSGVQYQLKKIHEITGLDPMNFYDLSALLQAIDERNKPKRYRYYCINHPPAQETVPKFNELVDQCAFDTRCYVPKIDRMAWGWVEYERELTPAGVARCGLIMQPRECEP